ncbi:N-6 DNA methylase [Nocardiopsis rhodophaea]|uniref:N-6 DNA methylase n=1 Tax=Nocardiopsis rhodophaea TaxID=280238 RepID=UPI0031D7D26F
MTGTSPPADLTALIGRLSDRNKVRSEATLQADVRQLLLTGGLNLADHDLDVDLEAPVGDRRRIDVEVGYTVIEVKKDLSKNSVLTDAVAQLQGYVVTRSQQTGQRYVGVLTDGADWRAYELRGEQLVEATRFTLRPRTDPPDLLMWLEGVLATRHGIVPTPNEISLRLGASSASHQLDRSALASLYEQFKDEPTVQMKRQLWARLLRSALGTQFHDDDSLFIEHTLLVNSADIIAHCVLGVEVADLQPATLLLGRTFEQAHIAGVVEADFFDWVLEVPGGDAFVRTLTRRLARFDWAHVEHDVLKVLYESVIGSETRKSLGEYYTPDWLAEHMVAGTVTDPLNQRVLDPSCGSGTFLFHAARRYLKSAEAAGIPLADALHGLTDHVAGIDLHPVAASLARVTYLLAIGRDKLTSSQRGSIRVPVYLGDSVQWEQRLDLFDQGYLIIRTHNQSQLFQDELRFPQHLLQDSLRFDQLVNELADLAAKPRKSGTIPSLKGLFNRLAISRDDQAEITENFRVLCQLVDDGRNHIWSYYVRNLARPMWISLAENRVDVLIGNPPWLSYRHMPAEMQDSFKELSQERGLWEGGQVASHQDLSALFIARAVEQYLRPEGNFAFVVPNAVLDRPYFTGFRRGRYHTSTEHVDVAFTGSWDLRRLRPHIFPRGSGVVFGQRTVRGNAKALPGETQRWSGRLPAKIEDWETAQLHITREEAILSQGREGVVESPYQPRFWQGATVVPRFLFLVNRQDAGPLGLGGGRISLRSARSSYEKLPWRDLPDLEGVVEQDFLYPLLLGESVIPYRVLQPRSAVLPLEGGELLHSDHIHLQRYPDLAQWWEKAEELWDQHRSTDRLTLVERLDFQRGLTHQIPAPQFRLVYGKAGMHVSAALVDDPRAVIDHTLYWGTVTSREEGMYLCAILNTPVLTELVRPLMSYGKDERHIDKSLWRLPIPLYDSNDSQHRRISELGEAEAQRIAALHIDTSKSFIQIRRALRKELAISPNSEELDALVTELLD